MGTTHHMGVLCFSGRQCGFHDPALGSSCDEGYWSVMGLWLGGCISVLLFLGCKRDIATERGRDLPQSYWAKTKLRVACRHVFCWGWRICDISVSSPGITLHEPLVFAVHALFRSWNSLGVRSIPAQKSLESRCVAID